MLAKIAQTKNTDRVTSAYETLRDRPPKVPGMMLVHGVAGYGKTTACEHLLSVYGGVSIRAQAFWSPSGMLQSICDALGIESFTRPYRTVNHIATHLQRNPQPLVIDEVDHLFPRPLLLEGLRDIHDLTGNPVVLVGMAGADKRVLRHPQLLRRLTQSVALAPLDREDLGSIAQTLCTPALADDLLGHLLESSKGSTGLAVVGLSQIDRFCAGEELVTLKLWQQADKPLFLGSKLI